MTCCDQCRKAGAITVAILRQPGRETESYNFCDLGCAMRWVIKAYAEEQRRKPG